MSVAGDAVEDQGDDGAAEPADIEGDVPKPAFEEPEPQEPAEPQQARGPTRKERRAERAGGYAAEVARWRTEAQQERTERQKLAERFARLEGEMQASRTAAAGAAPDPVREQLRAVRTDIEKTLERMGTGDTRAVQEWHDLREREQRIISRAEAEALYKQNAPAKTDPVLDSVRARHDWLATDPDLRQIAEGNVARLVRQEKRDMSDPAIRKQTLLQAAAEVERDFQIGGGGTEPTETQKERYRGTSGQSSGAGGSNSKSMVYLTGDQKAQAESLFRDLDPDAAHKKWWEKIGKAIKDKPGK